MKRDPLLYGIIGVLAGGIVVWFMATIAVNNNMSGAMRTMGMQRVQSNMTNDQLNRSNTILRGAGMGMSMNQMMENLNTASGEEFDKVFILEMIDHHQGAINMANEAKTKAQHEEIKNLAQNIITAQTNEIEIMRQWLKDWWSSTPGVE